MTNSLRSIAFAGKEGLILTVERDETEFRKLERDFQYLSSVVKSSDESIVCTTLNGKIAGWNSAAERLFGYTEAEALGEHIMLLFPKDRRNECIENLDKIVRGERLKRYESKRLRKDGSEFDVSVMVSPIEDGDGKLLGVSSITRDTTERVRANVSLQVAKKVAEMASRAKSEFLTNMGHELRTPLNGIIGFAEVLLDSALADDHREELTVIKESANSLLKTLSDILDISKIQSGQYLLHVVQLRLRDVVANVVTEFETTARDKNVQLNWHVEANVPAVVLGNSDGLRQILSNLVENAVKFTAAGKVSVAVTVSPQDPSLVCIEVRDTGMGVPVDRQRTIFEPFSQVDNSLRRKFGGTGLGLAICAQIVEIMGGRIWVESDGRNGSTFHFTVHLQPINEGPERTAPEPGMRPTPGEHRRETRRTVNESVEMRILRPISLLPFTVRVLDISNSGLSVLTSQPIETEALVQFNFGNDVTLAEVRYCLPTGDKFHVGLQIIQ